MRLRAVKSTTASTTKPAGIAYAAVFVGSISKAVTNTELQETFRTDALVGRYYRKGNRGFAKILVPDHELDRALSQNSSSHDHKFHGVAKWHDAKAPSSRAYRSAQVSATSVGCCKMSSATIASGAEFFMREKWKQMASNFGPITFPRARTALFSWSAIFECSFREDCRVTHEFSIA